MHVHWFGFDLESEVSGFRVAFGKHPNATDVLQFQDVGLVTNITLPFFLTLAHCLMATLFTLQLSHAILLV